ncbi:alpha-L-rhamnosidase [Agromyces albus]|nr:alpha-L-rhamnosidase [Agromyces albus]
MNTTEANVAQSDGASSDAGGRRTVLGAPTALRTNGRVAPLGIDASSLHFNWRADTTQSAKRVQIATAPAFEALDLAWDSDQEEAGATVQFPYSGEGLQSRTKYWWRAQYWDQAGERSPWSVPATFETGMDDSAWNAHWVGSPSTSPKDDRTLYFRREAELSSAVVRGRAYVSALGWYRLFLNGRDITGHALVPRWTPFDKFAEYQVYDVTDHFREGVNTIGVAVADGRYRGVLGIWNRRANYGDHLGVLAQLELELADGSHVTISSDESWRVGEGRIQRSDPKYGERVDFRISDSDWLKPGGNALNEKAPKLLEHVPPKLIAEDTARVESVETLRGEISRTPSGAQLIDFGQNFAGVARVRLSGPAGRMARLDYSEVLTPEGEVDTNYLATLKPGGQWFQRDEAIMSGRPIDYTPWFTIHGFRYVAVYGSDYDLTSSDVEGIVLSSRMDQIASFHASDQRLEQLWRNAFWSMRSNFTDTATDCPTRERSGWTGDVQVFSPTALQLADSGPFLRRYLRNLAAEQNPDGTVPAVIPAEDSPGHSRNRLFRDVASTSVGWGDVAVMLPWDIYRYTGDESVLRSQYASARAWVEQLCKRAETKRRWSRRLRSGVGQLERYILDTGYHWGEWLRPDTEMLPEIARNFVLSRSAIATAYYANSTRLLSKIAETLGNDQDATRFRELSANVRRAWRAAFVRQEGSRIADDKQDDYVRALAFDLLENPEQRARALARLVSLIEKADDHLGTGFLSTPMLLSTLVDEGRPDVAFRLLFQETSPSWLAQIRRGATTIWETWEGYNKKGEAHESHNHYALGSVVQFLQERIAGLAPMEPGYRRLRIAPQVGGGLRSASVVIETPYGPASSAWSLDDDNILHLKVLVPPGSSAEVHIGDARFDVFSGEHEFRERIPSSASAGWVRK